MAAAVAATMIVPHTSSQQELLDNALFMQREAIATNRKNRFLTTDYKENKFFKPVHQISRRVDQAGTEENLAARGGAMKALTAWNAAYKDLEDDGTAEPDLGKVNEGMSIVTSHVSMLWLSFLLRICITSAIILLLI